MNSQPTSLREMSCADDYDPNSMSVAKARAWIQSFLIPVTGTEKINIRAALDRVLAEDVKSPFNVPAHDNSAMDGFAVRFDDLSSGEDVTLRVVGTAFAGKPHSASVATGECVRIMTGAVVPPGLDTIVMQERAVLKGEQVTIGPGFSRGQSMRYAGEDIKTGQIAISRGKIVRPAELGLLASLGVSEVLVFRRLRVAFFSTGDELCSIGSTLGVGQVYDSNRYTLYGMLTRMNVEVLDMGVIPDDPKKIEDAFLQAAAMADVVITSGGVSVGEADYVKALLTKLGEVVFWKIAMKPGRPLAYGKIGSAHFFGLPGNPVSVMVTFYQFVREAILLLMGVTQLPLLPTVKVPCTNALKKVPGRMEFQRGILSQDAHGAWSVRASGDQGSGILSSMSVAHCFIILDEAQGAVSPGTLVEVQLLEGLI